jgi:glycosyltransferase involved in cell wall biosynthesis
MPAISVLMPVWNGCRNGTDAFLRMAIESILMQTYSDLEFVIVDDGSRDATPAIVESYRIRDPRIKIVTLPENRGIVGALNAGLDNCEGRFVARQDADDMSTVTRLEIEKDFLDNRPETVMCGTGMYVINAEGKLLMEINDRPCSYPVIREALKTCCVFVHGSVMFRKSAVLDVGKYSDDPRFRHAEDYELWVRLAKNHVVENIPERTLYYHREHQSKIGNVHKAQQDTASHLIMTIARATIT